jgi:hypothetical protein
MIEEYTRKFYIPTCIQHNKLIQNNFEMANKKALWLKKVYNSWGNIKIVCYSDNMPREVKISSEVTITAKIYLSELFPEDVIVQVYSGYISTDRAISSPITNEMYLVNKDEDNYIFESKIIIDKVGKLSYTMRILPQYNGEIQYIPELIKWV